MEEGPEEHPILARDVVRGDGSHTIAFRVFCPRQGGSVPLDRCEVCPSCLDVTAGPGRGEALVHCAPPAKGARITGGEPFGGALLLDGPAVGDILTQTILCVGRDLGVSSVIELFVERALPSVFVVDEEGGLLGLIREVDLVPSRRVKRPSFPSSSASGSLVPERGPDRVNAAAITGPPPSPAGEGGARIAEELMSSAIAVCEDTPIRQALLRMAGSHLRDAAIVTRTGELVGVLRDIEGLRWIAAHKRSTR